MGDLIATLDSVISEPNPFISFHSDRSRISGPADRYRRECCSLPSLSDLLSFQECERPLLMSDPEGVYHTNVQNGKDLTNEDVLFIRDAFRHIISREANLRMTEKAFFLYCTYLLTTHARQGHVFFKEPMYYSSDQIVASLGIDPYLVRKERTVMMDDIFRLIDDSLYNIASSMGRDDVTFDGFDLNNRVGEPPLGVTYLSDLNPIIGRKWLSRKDTIDLLRGMVAFGYADHFSTRMDARDAFPLCVDGKTPFHIGGGVDLPFVTQVMTKDPRDLGFEYRDIGLMAEWGWVLEDPRGYELPRAKNFYTRLVDEEGLSDIGTMILLDELHSGDGRNGRIAMVGGMIMDGVDSYKSLIYDPFYGNLPFYMANYIEMNYEAITGEPILTEREKLEIIYLGAKQNIRKIPTSQSHRFMNRGYHGKDAPVEALSTGMVHGVDLKVFNPFFDVITLADVVDIVRMRIQNYSQNREKLYRDVDYARLG